MRGCAGSWARSRRPWRVAWLLRNPVVSTAIVGAMTIEELRSILGALSVQLDDAVVERLDRIWPGPGEAPQAYSW